MAIYAYFIRTEGSEDNGFQPITEAYTYRQWLEVIKMLKESGKRYTAWKEEIYG